jgi:deoxyribonuclease-4
MNSCILETQWEIGSHLPYNGNISDVVLTAIDYGMYTTQFFMGDPKAAWKRDKISEEDIKLAKKLMNRYPINLFSHYPFCANLAGKATKGCLAWDGNDFIDNKVRGVLKALEYELGIISKFKTQTNKAGVIIHPGSNINREVGHLKVAETINKINFPNSESYLLLENCAGEGNKLCRTISELALVLNNIQEEKLGNVKVCIDTAHLWGQGDYNLSLVDEIDRLFEEFENEIGLENLHLIHLNDAGVPFGTKRDVHACLGQGYIWNQNFDSLRHLLAKCTEYRIPLVLETDISDMKTLGRILRKN